jgi:hypothetical protein
MDEEELEVLGLRREQFPGTADSLRFLALFNREPRIT